MSLKPYLIFMHKIKYITVLSLFTLFISGCSEQQTIKVTIDNPSAETLKITLNEKELIIPPFGYEITALNYGYNDISFVEGAFPPSINKKSFSFLVPPTASSELLMNPTGHQYVQTQVYYGGLPTFLDTFKTQFVLNNELYYDEVILDNGFIVLLSGDFGVHDALPEDISLKNEGEYRRFSKLFRFEDYKKFYTETYHLQPEATNRPDTQTKHEFVTLFKPFSNTYDLSHFSDRPELKKLITNYMDTLADLQKAYGSPEKFFKKVDTLNALQNQILNHADFNELEDNDLFTLWGPLSVDSRYTGSYVYGYTLFVNNEPS